MCHSFLACRRRWHLRAVFGNQPFPVAQFHFERDRFSPVLHLLNVAVDFHPGICAQHIFGPGKNIFDERGGNNPNGNLAINAAKGQIVNLKPKGRRYPDVRWNPRRQPASSRRQNQCAPSFQRKRSVPALIFTKPHAVDPYGRGGHDAFEVHKHATALHLWRQFEAATINGNEFVALFIKAVPRQFHVCVWNDNPVKGGVVKMEVMRACYKRPVISPVSIDRQDHPPARRRSP